MKILKLTSSACVLFLLAVGCKKTDFYDELPQDEVTAAASIGNSPLGSSFNVNGEGWVSSKSWDVENQEDFSIFYINLPEPAITADVVDNGLVLLFKKDNSTLTALPVEEDSKGDSKYWYHQVTEGNIMISADSYGAATSPDANSTFKHFVITPQKLKDLEGKGQTVDQLMSLTYEQAAALLGQK